MFAELKNRLQLSKKGLLILGIAALGMGLLLFGNFRTAKKEEAPRSDKEELEAYRNDLREEIESLCKSVHGVGRATVALTLDGGFTSVYACEKSSSGSETYVKLGSGSSASGLLLERRPPGILGIGVVCDGGDSPAVVSELTALLAATYKLPMTRIHVSPSK
ncbi:MAG: hypothetical protein IJR88_04165 [Clostridia bacterium]|nr:hypothetical protein [Clostridia bacterium]